MTDQHTVRPDQLARCRNWAKANPTDPFAFARALADYKSGIAGTNGIDYEVEFRSETKLVVDAAGEPLTSQVDGGPLTKVVEVPVSMKCP